MSAAAAGLSRVAAGVGSAAPSAGTASLHRGFCSAAAVSTAGSGPAHSVLWGQQQQQPTQRSALNPAAAPYHRWQTGGQRNLPVAAALSSAATAPRPFSSALQHSSRPHRAPHRRHYAVPAAQPAAQAGTDVVRAVCAGVLLEFERGGEHLLGRAVRQTSQGWQVEAASGTLYSVKQADIRYVLPPGSGATSDELAAVAAAAAAEAAASQDLLAAAWEIALEQGAAQFLTVPHMAELLFGGTDAAACASALRLLRDDRLYFKQVGRSPPMFTARPASQVEYLANELRQQQQAEAEWARFLEDVQQAQLQQRDSKPGEAAWRGGPHGARLAAVEGLALGTLPFSGPQRQLATQTLARLGKMPSTQDAADLLQSIGWWPPHLQLGLLAAGISERFPPELEAEAARLLSDPPPDLDTGRRRDFTAGHAVVTIDDASTTEIDDGLSLERLEGGGVKVWVHISDPSRWVGPSSPLASEARTRTKSLYLPTGSVPMFPRSLAAGPFSLRAGVATAAVSVGAVLDGEGALVPGSVEVVPSLVAPARRLTYDEVDGMLASCSEDEESDLFELARLAGLRREYRLSCGATEITMPESAISVEGEERDDALVTIREEDQHASPARQLVAEMMILAGEAVGRLGGELGVALPYRGQSEPVLPTQEELEAVPPGPCRAVMLRMRMTRSLTVTAAPLRHAGLGLDAYVQFTSPIRRFGDLLAHWQLKAALRGAAPPCDADQLAGVVDAVALATQEAGKREREAEAYWVAHYFDQATRRDPRAAWEAVFLSWLRQEAGLARVLLGGLGLEAVLRLNGPMAPGSCFYVRCVHADAKAGMYRLEELPRGQVSQASVLNDCSHLVGY